MIAYHSKTELQGVKTILCDIFSEDGYDPDGYGSDPYIEGMLSAMFNEDDLPSQRTHRYSIESRSTNSDIVDARIEENYSGRIIRVGVYRSRRAKLRVHCGLCDTEFIQNAESLFRSAYTRCKCSRKKQLPTIRAKNGS